MLVTRLAGLHGVELKWRRLWKDREMALKIAVAGETRPRTI
jgi:hypothetical protein